MKEKNNVKKRQIEMLSETEEKLIETLKTVNTVKLAANKIGIKPKTAYNKLYKIRKKYLRARHFVNFIEAQRRRHDRLAMLLTDRMQEKELMDNEEYLEAKVW